MNDVCEGYEVYGYFIQFNGIIRNPKGNIVCRIDEVEKKDKRIQELKTALLELKRPLKNAYEHIQHKDYNDALSSILEAQAIAEK